MALIVFVYKLILHRHIDINCINKFNKINNFQIVEK